MTRLVSDRARVRGGCRAWILWAVVGVGAWGMTADGRGELRVGQAAPEIAVQMPVEPQHPDVGTASSVGIEAYAYDRERRRDPFVSLLSRAADLVPPTARPPGLAGLSVNDVSLRGLVLSGGVYLAVMQAPDHKTYILRGDELLFDAVVKSVSAEGITFLQEVNDPLSLVREREVFRTLRRQEERR